MTMARPVGLDLQLPKSLEAREPPEARGLTRDAVRLLVSHSHTDWLEHARFVELSAYLQPGDLLVLNLSATLPAALTARRRDGSELALHLSTQLPAGLQVVEFRLNGGAEEHAPRSAEPQMANAAAVGHVVGEHTHGASADSVGESGKPAIVAGERFELPAGGQVTALAPHPGSERLWVARLELSQPLQAYLARWGRPITYPYLSGKWPIELYQNVYSTVPGSAEMASAGRPFTAEMLDLLVERGVFLATVVLHAGVSSLELGERPFEEYFEVSHETAAALRRAQRDRSRVIAVGTTVVRALETAVDQFGRPIASQGWTELVIEPRRGLRVVDGLLTGFHESNASHLDLVASVAGRSHLERAYRAALEHDYLWHEFGDLHLILPD